MLTAFQTLIPTRSEAMNGHIGLCKALLFSNSFNILGDSFNEIPRFNIYVRITFHLKNDPNRTRPK